MERWIMRMATICLFLAILILLSACESGAKFRVINRTSHPVYTALEGSDIVSIPGGEELIIDVDTDTQNFLTGTVKKTVPVLLKGETYSLIGEVTKPQQDTTRVVFEAGKTLNAFIDPNRAGIKIVNDLDTPIARVEITKKMVNYYYVSPYGNLFDIQPGAEVWIRVPPVVAHSTDPFYFQVDVIVNEDDATPYTFGDIDNILDVDDQFVITISPEFIEGDTK